MSEMKNYSIGAGDDWKQYLAGAVVDCIADSPEGAKGCARRIVMLASGDLSPCLNADGTNRPLTTLPLGYVHDAHVKAFTCNVACVVYW
jgi:hypothetical protein